MRLYDIRCESMRMWKYKVFTDQSIYSSILKIRTHGVVSENVGWVSVVWSYHSELCGSGGSRCRSWQKNELTGAC